MVQDWEDPFAVVNLDWDERQMRQAVLRLPKDRERQGKLRIFDSYSRAHLQERLPAILNYMDTMGFDATAGEIDKIVGEKPDPVWRVVITYRYEPYHFTQSRQPSPSH